MSILAYPPKRSSKNIAYLNTWGPGYTASARGGSARSDEQARCGLAPICRQPITRSELARKDALKYRSLSFPLTRFGGKKGTEASHLLPEGGPCNPQAATKCGLGIALLRTWAYPSGRSSIECGAGHLSVIGASMGGSL